uniref:G-protein coupled receptors family 1 profile domain-containing protein n=1 Tax=Pelusios castaneus TaxID=367368 RepID=A0A8C8SQ24_9SAUR
MGPRASPHPYLSVSGSVMEANATATTLSLGSPRTSPAPSTAMDLVQVTFYAMVFMGGCLGNGLVIWVTAHRATHSVNCVWFLNLAAADFLFSASRAVPLVKNTFPGSHWPFSAFLCWATSFPKYLNMFCNIFLLAAISLDHLAVVTFPVWSKNRWRPRLAWAATAGTWGTAAVASLPFYFYRTLMPQGKAAGAKCSLTLGEGPKLMLYLLRLLCGFLAPFAIIVACYGALRLATLRSKKPFKVMPAIVVTSFICWAPYHLFLLLKLAGVKGLAVTVGLPLASSLAYVNSCANPILYFFMGLDFRRALGHVTLGQAFHRALLDEMADSAAGPCAHRREAPSSVDRLAQTSVTPDLAGEEPQKVGSGPTGLRREATDRVVPHPTTHNPIHPSHSPHQYASASPRPGPSWSPQGMEVPLALPCWRVGPSPASKPGGTNGNLN